MPSMHVFTKSGWHSPLGLAPIAVGKNGLGLKAVEGDGVTPIGSFKITQIFYRPDKYQARPSAFSAALWQPLNEKMGWCDDGNDPSYNQLVSLPFKPSHEKLWRDDELYDLIAVLDYNMNPCLKNRGSALFIHIAHHDYRPTAGCIGLKPAHMLNFLDNYSMGDIILIQ